MMSWYRDKIIPTMFHMNSREWLFHSTATNTWSNVTICLKEQGTS